VLLLNPAGVVLNEVVLDLLTGVRCRAAA
jgi:hypothetical protein